MKIFLKKPKSQDFKTKVLFVSKEDTEKKVAKLPFKEAFQAIFKEGVFKGEEKESLFLPFLQISEKKYHVLLVGLGKERDISYESLREAGAKAYKVLRQKKQTEAEFYPETLLRKNSNKVEKVTQALAEGLTLISYECLDFKKPKKTPEQKPQTIHFNFSKAHVKKASRGLFVGEALAQSVNNAKRLATYPGNKMTPTILANETLALTKNTKIKTTVWDKARIKKEKMGGLHGVSLGSSEEPRFIIMEYKGGRASQKPVCLVGKGLTFDSGGISLKPAPSMDEMKFDMCGSTAVIGALLAIEKLKLKVNVLGLVPSSENMPGQSAMKPGDILKARNGKTIEVLNTDAEGRLILADALSYACEQQPQAIFDAATLTGAIVVALGNLFSGFFTKNERMVRKVNEAAKESGERVWRLPLVKEHSEDMKSALADIANLSSQRGAGSSTAAAFLENFVNEDIPWVHFDIAGTSYNTSNRLEYCRAKTASGALVRTFVELIRSFEK